MTGWAEASSEQNRQAKAIFNKGNSKTILPSSKSLTKRIVILSVCSARVGDRMEGSTIFHLLFIPHHSCSSVVLKGPYTFFFFFTTPDVFFLLFWRMNMLSAHLDHTK